MAGKGKARQMKTKLDDLNPAALAELASLARLAAVEAEAHSLDNLNPMMEQILVESSSSLAALSAALRPFGPAVPTNVAGVDHFKELNERLKALDVSGDELRAWAEARMMPKK